MSEGRWFNRLPLWIALLLVPPIFYGVDRLKNPDKHRAIMERMEREQREQVRWRQWHDSVIRAHRPERQAALAASMAAACESLKADSAWRGTFELSDYYGPSGTAERWVGTAGYHSRGIEFGNPTMLFRADTLPDSLAGVADRLVDRVVYFTAKFGRSAEMLNPCFPHVGLRLLAVESLAIQSPVTPRMHAASR